MVLGTPPGGITEMAITAQVLQLGVPVVTAFQVVLWWLYWCWSSEPLYRRIALD